MGQPRLWAVICRRERRRRTLLLVAVRATTRKIPDILARVRQEEILAVFYTPETERVSPPPPQPLRHTLDLTSLVEKALEGIGATNSKSCEEDLLFDDAVRTPALPGTEDDVVMESSSDGQLDDLEAAKCFLAEDDAL